MKVLETPDLPQTFGVSGRRSVAPFGTDGLVDDLFVAIWLNC